MFPDCSKIQTSIVGRQSFTIRNLAILATLDQDILMAREKKAFKKWTGRTKSFREQFGSGIASQSCRPWPKARDPWGVSIWGCDSGPIAQAESELSSFLEWTCTPRLWRPLGLGNLLGLFPGIDTRGELYPCVCQWGREGGERIQRNWWAAELDPRKPAGHMAQWKRTSLSIGGSGFESWLPTNSSVNLAQVPTVHRSVSITAWK